MPVSMYVIVVAGSHRNRKQLKAVMVGLGRYLNGNKDERILSTYSMLARKKIQFAQVTKFISSNYGLRTFHPSSLSSCTSKPRRRLISHNSHFKHISRLIKCPSLLLPECLLLQPTEMDYKYPLLSADDL